MSDAGALPPVLAYVSRFSRILVGPCDAAGVLQELTEQAGEYLHLPGVGIAVADRTGHLRFAAGREACTTRLQRAQEGSGSGPATDAYRDRQVVTSNDLRHEQRWPEFTAVALDAGMCAAAGIPMGFDGCHLGAFSLYAATPREWSDDELEAARTFADMATSFLLIGGERERACIAAPRSSIDAVGGATERHWRHPRAASRPWPTASPHVLQSAVLIERSRTALESTADRVARTTDVLERVELERIREQRQVDRESAITARAIELHARKAGA